MNLRVERIVAHSAAYTANAQNNNSLNRLSENRALCVEGHDGGVSFAKWGVS